MLNKSLQNVLETNNIIEEEQKQVFARTGEHPVISVQNEVGVRGSTDVETTSCTTEHRSREGI